MVILGGSVTNFSQAAQIIPADFRVLEEFHDHRWNKENGGAFSFSIVACMRGDQNR
jgi:hypothetical protein